MSFVLCERERKKERKKKGGQKIHSTQLANLFHRKSRTLSLPHARKYVHTRACMHARVVTKNRWTASIGWQWCIRGREPDKSNRVEQNRGTRRLLHLIERENSHRCQQSRPEGKEFSASLEIRCSWGGFVAKTTTAYLRRRGTEQKRRRRLNKGEFYVGGQAAGRQPFVCAYGPVDRNPKRPVDDFEPRKKV